MKNNDIALVIVIAAASIVGSFFLGNLIFGDPKDKTEEVKYMDAISSELAEPDEDAFNPYMLNPTVEVYVGQCRSGYTWDEDLNSCVDPNRETEEAQKSTENEE
ncbi:hypothetical protein IKF15_02975 [Candidatus Saccharibacteria bacterium]|nr:hypothetical protein [Candidatus Saccharibacteria bacterium]